MSDCGAVTNPPWIGRTDTSLWVCGLNPKGLGCLSKIVAPGNGVFSGGGKL